MDNCAIPLVCPPGEEMKKIQTKHSGSLNVFIQGKLFSRENRAIFLTVHDIGSNHTSFKTFVSHPSMAEIRERSVFVHVDLPGQQDNAADLPDEFKFPSMQELSEDLVDVLEALDIECVIGLGEGAGANILTRLGLKNPARCLGLILVHCTSTVAGVMEYFRDQLINWKLSNIGMNPTAEQYLVFHKFGHSLAEQLKKVDNKEKVMAEFQAKLRENLNPKNLRRYVEAFLNRTDLSERLQKGLKVDVLLVTGALASHLHTVHTMASHLDKAHSTLFQIDGVGDVLNEAPEKLAHSLLLFVQGLGMLSSIPLPGIDRRTRTISSGPGSDQSQEASKDGATCKNRLGDENFKKQRAMSMEEYDVPNVRRLSNPKN